MFSKRTVLYVFLVNNDILSIDDFVRTCQTTEMIKTYCNNCEHQQPNLAPAADRTFPSSLKIKYAECEIGTD